MRDVIRMAAEGGLHYLAVFDDHSERPLYLGCQTRIATPINASSATRATAAAPAPPAWHPAITARSTTARPGRGRRHRRRQTVLRLPPDHKLLTDGHCQTTVTDTGRLAWTDATTPPQINHAHHPEELLHGDTDPPADHEE
jgi:hypothetical protein